MTINEHYLRTAIRQADLRPSEREALSQLITESVRLSREWRKANTPRPTDEWHEDIGPALWWKFPINEPPYCGSPLDLEFPGYHTHWTPIICPKEPI